MHVVYVSAFHAGVLNLQALPITILCEIWQHLAAKQILYYLRDHTVTLLLTAGNDITVMHYVTVLSFLQKLRLRYIKS